jgi:cation diffusion facilitator family transporter
MLTDKAKTLVVLALAGHLAAAAAVVVAYQAVGASALLTLSILLFVVIAHHLVLLSGLAETQRPADARHPFGYGRELYFWSFVAAVLFFAHGAGVAVFEGISKLKAPEFVSLGGTAQAMLFVAVVIEAGIAYCWTTAFPARDGAASALDDFRDPVRTVVVVENLAAVAAVLVALAGLNAAEHSGWRAADAVASLGIAAVMAAVAAVMCVRTKAVLVGEAAGPSLRSALRTLIGAETGAGCPIAAIDEIKTLNLGGGDLLVSANVRFKDGSTAGSVADTAARLQRAIQEELPQVSHFFLSVPGDADAGATAPPTDDGPEPPLSGGQARHGKKGRRH